MIRISLTKHIRNAPLRYRQARTLVSKYRFLGRAAFNSEKLAPRRLNIYVNRLGPRWGTAHTVGRLRGRQIKILPPFGGGSISGIKAVMGSWRTGLAPKLRGLDNALSKTGNMPSLQRLHKQLRSLADTHRYSLSGRLQNEYAAGLHHPNTPVADRYSFLFKKGSGRFGGAGAFKGMGRGWKRLLKIRAPKAYSKYYQGHRGGRLS